ncbi:MAG: T9SS type A sorting domain-containing protein [Flavobacteriales bacterium]|nr:T9SS type A sorting domain-containing protein [Flavobacteriales bacterium]MBK6945079.1 T9SS type A sorting domain-containing protein [Flavobacteriales bacterium]MBK7295962.1 T9SS type A sorting domain-containing protein [Flavobacteriales bacterium]
MHSNSGCSIAIADVVWRATNLSVVNTTSGNTITKASSSGVWDGNAFSWQSIGDNGYMETTAQETTTIRAVGISSVDANASYSTIQFGFVLNTAGVLRVVENGGANLVFTIYSTGDVLRIAIDNGKVRYYQNGVVLYTSSQAPVMPLYADVSTYDIGATVANVKVANPTEGNFVVNTSGGGTTPIYQWKLNGGNVGASSTSYSNASITAGSILTCNMTTDADGCVPSTMIPSNPIVLQNRDPTLSNTFHIQGTMASTACVASLVDVVWRQPTSSQQHLINGNSLTNVSSTNAWDGNAFSWQAVGNNGFMETTAQETNRFRMVGLSAVDTDADYQTIDYAFYLDTGSVLRIFESGSAVPIVFSYATGDLLRIAVDNGGIQYLKNGALIHVSVVSPTLPMYVDVSTRNAGATVANVKVGNLEQGVFTAVANNAGVTPSYQWILNGAPVGTNSPTYTNGGLMNGDFITCELTPSVASCTSTAFTSNTITIIAHDPSQKADLNIANTPAATGCSYAIADARWNESSLDGGIVVTGNTATKQGNEGQWDGNAFSLQSVADNGYMETTITGPVNARMFGLSSVDANAHYSSIQYAFYLNEVGGLQVFESGVPRATSIPYVNGDLLRIEVQNGVVVYYQNGQPIYFSGTTPSLPLYVDMSLKRIPGTMANVKIANISQGTFVADASGLGASPGFQWKLNGVDVGINSPTYTNTIFADGDVLTCNITLDQNGCSTNTLVSNPIRISTHEPISPDHFHITVPPAAPACLVAVTNVSWRRSSVDAFTEISGNRLIKVNGADVWNSNGFSWDAVYDDGYMETTIQESASTRCVGLSSSDIDASYLSIDHAFLIEATGVLKLFERGILVHSSSHSAGDVLRLALENGIVRYYTNGTPLYTSTALPSLPLYVDASIRTVGGTIDNVRVGNSTHGTFAIATDPSVTGSSPSFQWKLNGANVGSGTQTYSNSALVAGDLLACQLTTGIAGCGGYITNSTEYLIKNAHSGSWTEAYIAVSDDPSLCTNTVTDVTWQASTTLLHHHVSGNNIVKTNDDLVWNGNAFSWQPVPNNGYMETTVQETNTSRAIGLSNADIDGNYTSIAYAFVLRSNGVLKVYENGGTALATSPYSTGDELRIELKNGTVQYFQNSALLYSSTVVPTFPLYVDGSTAGMGATLAHVRIGNTGGSVFTSVASNAGSSPTYQWQLNGTNVGTNSPTYVNAMASIGDAVTCLLTPDINGCANSTYTSNAIQIPSNSNTAWLGITTSWHDPDNWSNGVPNTKRDAVINSGTLDPVIINNTAIHSISIGTGRSLTIQAGVQVEITGNWSNAGSLNATTSTVHFMGCDLANNVTCSSSETFYNVVIDNANGVNFTSGTHEVGSNIDFIQGIVTNTSLLLLQTTASATNMSDISHVVGPVRKAGAQPFVFPVGDGSFYRPIAITAPTSPTTISAEYHPLNSNAFYPHSQRTPTIQNLDLCEYWDLDRIAGSGLVHVTLSWSSTATPNCLVALLIDLQVARWSSTLSQWQDHSNGGTTGNVSAGTIVSIGPLNELGPFTLSSAFGVNPLPVELISFNAVPNGDVVDLAWSTASEINNELFVIERSVDAEHFEPILDTPGAGTSLSVQHYALVDRSPLSGTSYYRLLQLDSNGTIYRSNVVAIYRPEATEDDNVLLYPNPSGGIINILIKNFSENLLNVELHDAMGRSVISEYGYAPLFHMDASGLSTGAYRIVISDRGHVMHIQMWIKH